MEIFFAALFALFCESFKSRDSYCEQFNDDGCIDVRGNRHCEQRTVVKSITCHHTKVCHKVVCVLIRDESTADIDKRDGKRGTESEYKDDKCRKEHHFYEDPQSSTRL